MSETNSQEQAGKPSAPLLGSAPQNHPVLKAIELARLQVELCGGAVAMMLKSQEECERWRLIAETNKMTWRHEPPTAEGFYWLRRRDDIHGVWLGYVEHCPQTGKFHVLTTGGSDNQSFEQYDWAGPLIPPHDAPNPQAEARRDRNV